MSITKIEQFLWGDLQNLTELKNHIEGNTYISQFDRTDMTAVNIHQLCQFHLGQPLAFAVIDHIQAKLFIKAFILLLHQITSTYIVWRFVQNINLV